MILFVRYVMQTPWCLGVMGFLLVFVPSQECGQFTNTGGNTGNHLTESTSRVIINTKGLECIPAHVSERKKNRKTNPCEREVGSLLVPPLLTSRGYYTIPGLWSELQVGSPAPIPLQLNQAEHSLWERVAEGSNPFTPILIHNGKMQFYSVEYWQENWETLMERVENGETIGVENENGDRAVMIPADDEIIRIYKDLNNEAS